MLLYPLPAGLALVGWIAVFAGTKPMPMAFSIATIAVGSLAFGIREWSRPTADAGA